MSGWYFKVRPVHHPSVLGEYIAWCAHTPDLRDGPLEVDLAEEVYSQFGSSAEDALAKLKAEVLS